MVTKKTGRWAASFLGLYASVAILVVGCDNDELPPGITKKAIAFDKVPEPMHAAAKKHIPGVDFKEAWENLDSQGKLHSYEIRGQQSNGKIREVRVSPSGEILESE
ncbi:hypothetical protein [Aquisphaera insulae]|uniref:hypothetical protein n=1 Tax=Aquisphaera insulae TaxID=2712864 RepID=UPI0013EC39B4|nr:hypothetical protein [Aquisphaera insulae]